MNVAQKLTLDDIQAKIEEAKYENPVGTLTICILSLTNGFLVTGESACLNPEDFNADLGNKIAYENAESKVWMLEAYLRQEIAYRRSEPLAGQPVVLDTMAPAADPVFMAAVPEGKTIVNLPTILIQPHDGLEQYLGVKIVNAKPMTRAVYNQIRGWDLPSDENGDDAGYLVEYTDAQRPNLTGFEGYVSWSPKDVFDGAYTTTAVPQPEPGNGDASQIAQDGVVSGGAPVEPGNVQASSTVGSAMSGSSGTEGNAPLSTAGLPASSTGGDTTGAAS